MTVLGMIKKVRIVDLIFIFKFLIAIIISKFICIIKKNDDIWMISERKDEARDNGYYLFKYIRDHYPDKRVYYVIEKGCTDYYKICNMGNIVYHNSIRHNIIYILAKYNISAHKEGGMPNERVCRYIEKLNIIKSKYIFLQHGITKDYIDWLIYDNTNYDLFVCGARPEYEYVKNNFGYPKDNVKYLGLCRFDGLNLNGNIIKKQILIMPTWRKKFKLNIDKLGYDKACKEFKESEYYKNYNNLINDKDLNRLLRENQIKLIFYPHYEMQDFIHLFDKKYDAVEIADKNKYDVQMLLKESKLLITDYSSVYFDFAYMGKPLIYFHFDYDEYREDQYSEGYFNYGHDGFGDIALNVNSLKNYIFSYVHNDFDNSKYNKRIKKFFTIKDKYNCKRTYEAIKNL